jgi:CRISPR type III-associated protein (TIGR04423 family)
MGNYNFRNEGYIWFSDATEPIVLSCDNIKGDNGNVGLSFDDYAIEINGGKCIVNKDGKESLIPFIIEGFFICNDTSYSIKMVDGKYYIFSKELNSKGDKEEFSEIKYYTNRFGENISQLVFRKYWKEEADALCENMKVLTPTENIFVGFEFKDSKTN